MKKLGKANNLSFLTIVYFTESLVFHSQSIFFVGASLIKEPQETSSTMGHKPVDDFIEEMLRCCKLRVKTASVQVHSVLCYIMNCIHL